MDSSGSGIPLWLILVPASGSEGRWVGGGRQGGTWARVVWKHQLCPLSTWKQGHGVWVSSGSLEGGVLGRDRGCPAAWGPWGTLGQKHFTLFQGPCMSLRPVEAALEHSVHLAGAQAGAPRVWGGGRQE